MIFMKRLTIISLFIFYISVIAIGQYNENIRKPKYERVGEAYGYILGMEHTLSSIKNKYPQYELNATKAQTSFDLSFGKAKERMQKYMIDIAGEERIKNLKNEVKKTLSKNITNEKFAKDFISEVESRAMGKIPSPVLETLLHFQYMDMPQGEFLAGYTTTYKTKGHPKSKNTDWQIKIPKSWIAKEGDRPNIIKKFISDYGTGMQIVLLMVQEMPLPENYKFSKAELDDLFSEKEIKEFVPRGGKFISFQKMKFDGCDGCMLEYELSTTTLDQKLKNRVAFFMFIYGNKMYSVQCYISSGKPVGDLTSEMKKFMPLFRHIASSVVVNDKWKKK